MPNGGKTLNSFYLFNNNVYSDNFFTLYNNLQRNFYNKETKLNNWRLIKNDKTNVDRCNPFRTDQSCITRK